MTNWHYCCEARQDLRLENFDIHCRVSYVCLTVVLTLLDTVSK